MTILKMFVTSLRKDYPDGMVGRETVQWTEGWLGGEERETVGTDASFKEVDYERHGSKGRKKRELWIGEHCLKMGAI